MTHMDDDDLLDAALDVQRDADASSAAAEHLQACATCRAQLALTRRTVEALRTVGQVSLEPPPNRVWAAIEAEIQSPNDGARTGATAEDATGSAGAPSRPETAGTSKPSAGRGATVVPLHRRLPGRLLLAAASLVIGAVGGSAVTRALSGNDARSQQVVQEAGLTTLDTNVRRGVADLVKTDGGTDLRLSTEPLDPGSGYLEVWLINRDLQRMVSVGVLPPDTTAASFPVPSRLLDEGYVIVDISREALDDKPEHSGVSLLRGELAV